MKIMVTGASGFVGSSICARLMHTGHDVIAVVRNLNEPSPLDFDNEWKPKTIVPLDFTDYTSTEMVISKYKPDIMVHTGAQAIVRKSVETPRQTFDINVTGTINLLEACRVANKKMRLFYQFSTDKIYGEKNNAKEDDPYLPTCPYSSSKISAEVIVKSYHDTYGMNTLITRSCNIYGHGDFNKRVIPNTILDLLNGFPATIYTGDSNMYRQYIHIDDLSDAVNYLINRSTNEEKPLKDIYNIGGEGQYSTEDVVRILVNYSNGSVTLVPRKDSLKEISSQSVNIDRITEDGWIPMIGMTNGLQLTYNWYRENKDKIEAITKT